MNKIEYQVDDRPSVLFELLMMFIALVFCATVGTALLLAMQYLGNELMKLG